MKAKNLLKLCLVAMLMLALLLTSACAKKPEEPAKEEEQTTEAPAEETKEEPEEEEKKEEEPAEEPKEEEPKEEVPEEKPEPTTTLDTDELQERMYHYFECMQNGQFAEIVEDFSLNLKGMLDENGLSSAWKSVTAPRGAFIENKEMWYTIEEGGGVTVYLVSAFEKYGMETRYIFDANGDIDGIWFYDETIKEDDSGEKYTDEMFKELIENGIQQMRDDKFEELEEMFSNGLKTGLDAEGLRKSWAEVTNGIGEFEKNVGSQVTHLAENQNEVVIISKFSGKALKTVFVCRDNGKIAEIWFYYM